MVRVEDSLTFSRNMTIQWSDVPLIEQNGELTRYTVKYNPVDANVLMADVSAENNFFLAVDLIPGRLYTIQVAASTSQGLGVFSQPIFKDTLEEGEWWSYMFAIANHLNK